MVSTRRVDAIKGLETISVDESHDPRGVFRNLFRSAAESPPLLDFGVRQVNLSFTKQHGTIRGMHLQVSDAAEEKVVHCLKGEIFDVIVDLRPNSVTCGRWYGQVLSADHGMGLLIPRGCAHGFQTLTNSCEVLYLHDRDYVPASESGVNALDETLGIEWPLPVTSMSERDKKLGSLDEALQRSGFTESDNEL